MYYARKSFLLDAELTLFGCLAYVCNYLYELPFMSQKFIVVYLVKHMNNDDQGVNLVFSDYGWTNEIARIWPWIISVTEIIVW